MPEILRYFIHGIGSSVNIFPSRRELHSRPSTGEYFSNAGRHIRTAIEKEGPAIRRDSKQMELKLHGEKTGR